jgi:Protein of unknown function (DUF992)
MTRVGLDVGATAGSVIIWAVLAVTDRYKGVRTGTYTGASAEKASQPSCATRSACSDDATEQSRATCICSSGTMPSRQHARIQSLVCRAAEPWISAFIALGVSARRNADRPYQGCSGSTGYLGRRVPVACGDTDILKE